MLPLKLIRADIKPFHLEEKRIYNFLCPSSLSALTHKNVPGDTIYTPAELLIGGWCIWMTLAEEKGPDTGSKLIGLRNQALD